MYFGDHNPPHFHAIYQEEMAEYDINTFAEFEETYLIERMR